MVRRSGIVEDIFAPKTENKLIPYQICELYDQNRTVRTGYGYKMNNGYLDEKFDADPRPGVVASLTASSLSKMQYQQRLDALNTLHNCDTIPSKNIHIKAFTSSKPTKSKAPCHNFARGSCKFGDTCKYAHGDLTSPKKNPIKPPFLAT